MATTKKSSSKKKSSVKVSDLKPAKDAKGGRGPRRGSANPNRKNYNTV